MRVRSVDYALPGPVHALMSTVIYHFFRLNQIYKKRYNSEPLPCPHCDRTFSTYEKCKEHIKVKHENDTHVHCDECNRAESILLDSATEHLV